MRPVNQQAGTPPPSEPTNPVKGEEAEPVKAEGEGSDDWRSFRAGIEKRVGDMGRQVSQVRKDVRGMLPGEPPEGSNGSAAPTERAVTVADIEAARQLGGALERLPEASREAIEAKLADGLSYADALATARLVADAIGSAASAKGATPANPGTAIAAAPQDQGGYPTTIKELLQLKEDNPKRYAQIMHHSYVDFDQSRLKRG